MTNFRDQPTRPRVDKESPTEPDTDDARVTAPNSVGIDATIAAELHATMASIGVESHPPTATIPSPPMAAASTAGTLVGGKYELIRLIAEGGMGKVFLAQHRELRMRVAVKIMHDHIAMNSEHVERFRREALAASRLMHPNIVKVLDFGSLDETFYIVMEYVEGQSLGDWLEARTEIPALSEILPILMQILDALIEAHAAGIVHRDLKPDNILLAQDARGTAWVKIVDFGLARFRDPGANEATITHADAVAGTPAYMSPEQCRSLKVSYSTDLYAYGCILTELLQLEPVFAGDSMMEVISKHMFAPVPDLQRPAGAEALPPLIDRLRRDLLAKLPSQRPADASIVRNRLVAAMQSDASDAQLTMRKSQLNPGDRAGRTPEWNREATTAPNLDPSAKPRIEYRPLVDTDRAVDAMCLVGLSSLGFDVRETSALLGIESGSIALLDAGANAQLAAQVLKELRLVNPDAGLVVCLSGINVLIIGSLIEAGADDVVRGPATSDLLGRKLGRLKRNR